MICPIVTYTRPSRLYNNGGSLIQIYHREYSESSTPLNGDRYQMFFYARGNEARLNLGTSKGGSKGIFDIYVNGVLDSSGYDDYAGGTTPFYRYIALTQPIQLGYNVIELRVNGKNASSVGYAISVYGASIQ